MDNVREMTKILRELADLYDELVNINENEELDAQQKEESQEGILGKIMIKMMKINK